VLFGDDEEPAFHEGTKRRQDCEVATLKERLIPIFRRIIKCGI
jgi:hypothetical protein